MSRKEKKTVFYGFKASPAEDVLIHNKMQKAGMTNRSAYVRTMALNGYILKLDLPELRQATRLIGYLGNNVNQIAERLHRRGSIYDTEIDEILEKQNEIQKTLTQILQSLNRMN
ncbi:MAG: plasmid mobilization relaxosome protein MobC [Clostridia bacterium]|nr:plasmid mobilization relaxosome protein MobC [Clostridia bacterium]MBR6861789.1 plasmid mobilization relaxosome protein MobC [Acidaminococcaceae bacterium]